MQNISRAFPDKTEAEKIQIAKEFYRNFTDSFIEIIKLLTVSKKDFRKRFSSNVEVMNDLYDHVPSVALVSGHFFSWEFVNYQVALEGKFNFLVVYMPVANKAFDKLIYKLRSRFGSNMISATNYRAEFLKHAKTKYSMGLVADQAPGNPDNAYWVPFFGKLTPFVKGPEKSSKSANSAVIFVDFQKPKRGFYHFEYTLITTEPKNFPEGGITKEMVRMIEEGIRKEPANYLWSHRRWKHEFDEEKHRKLVV